MEAVLAVIVGIAFGSALAAAVAFPLRRRRRRQSSRLVRARRIPLQTSTQRHRAAIVAAVCTMLATVAMIVGLPVVSAYLMLGAVFLCAQAATSAALTRTR